ncbi:MAG: uracil-DNA glycosylase, partial [Armatimonadota bacterium]|nr:uracil-DNA glycosylase [Armatimonadota bacterium]
AKRRAYREWEYWGKPVPNFGDPHAQILVVGLAPAAHGGNRTGRIFTGDESGNWLFRALYEVGLASHPESVHREDGMELRNALITAVCHCAPPANKPNREELQNCQHWMRATIRCVHGWKVIVALGRIAFEWTLRALKDVGVEHTIRASSFAHGAEFALPDGRWIVCSYHPSQQNTFTRKLTREMLRDVLERAIRLAE